MLLLASACYLFLAGSSKYKKASQGIVNFGFKNSEQEITPSSFEALEIIIENHELDEISIDLYYYLDGQEIIKKSTDVTKNTEQIIPVPQEIKDSITTSFSEQQSFRYEIKTSWNNQENVLYKKIRRNK